MSHEPVNFLLSCEEPWTRYNTLRQLLGLPADDHDVVAARAEMVAHSLVQGLIAHARTWGQKPFKRHSDASYPIYALSTLADFGLMPGDGDLNAAIESVLDHQSADGAFMTLINLPTRFGGSGEDAWTWIICDAPTLLYSLLAFGLEEDPRVQRAIEHLVGLVQENGWRCVADPALGRFRGPGRKDAPCPIANVYALKALSLVPGQVGGPAARAGCEMLLTHWQEQEQGKLYLFGIGTDFRKPKYPFVWYNILHVVDVLSRFPHLRGDRRLQEMVRAITDQADDAGRYTATSMYRAWKGWSFADKKKPSPWLTFLVKRIEKRMAQKTSDQ